MWCEEGHDALHDGEVTGWGLILPTRGGLGSGSAWLVSLVGATRFGPGAFGVGCRGRKVNELWEAPLQVLGRLPPSPVQNRRQPRIVSAAGDVLPSQTTGWAKFSDGSHFSASAE